ncbi:hypothetical protein ANN_05181, partial [Periplaneta americana]
LLQDLYVYLSENEKFTDFSNREALIWSEKGLVYGDWHSGANGDGIRVHNIEFKTSEAMQNNGTLYVHVYVTRRGKSPDPDAGKGVYAPHQMAYNRKLLNKYKRLRYTKTHNLLTGQTAATPEEVKKAETMKEEVVSHWHPNLTLNLVTDQTNWVQGSVPPPLDEYIEFLPGGDRYKPVIYFNEFWNMLRDYQPINKTTKTLQLSLTYQPLSLFKWQIYSAQAMRNKWTVNMLGEAFVDEEDEDQDSLKEALLETSPYLLAPTIFVSILHSVFELLAFKNDIQFWNNRKSLEGLSVRSVFFNVFQSLIVLLYVLDNDTNTVVKISCFVGLCIEVWKIHKYVSTGCINILYVVFKVSWSFVNVTSWEAYVQHINICNTLLRVDDSHLHNVRDLVSEKVSALSKLNITAIDAINWSGRKIRKHLRNDAFQTWTNHTLRGKGVIVYSDLPKANSWVSNRKGLSSSEWTNALKMSSNILAVRAIPGRTLSTTCCRHPDCSELETLGQCPKGELLINARHHRVRHALAISLKTLNWEIHEEVHCVSSDGSFRRADIIAINGRLKWALVLDPTIRFEKNLNQATEVDIEKKSIYEPCLPYLSQKYNVPLKQWSVIGLLFGSRGSITKFTWNYLKELHIPFDYVMDINVNSEARIFGLIPRISFSDKGSYIESSTKEYDMLAFRYLSWALYPLLGGYAVYSLLYQEHRGWYSFVLNMLYGFLLTFDGRRVRRGTVWLQKGKRCGRCNWTAVNNQRKILRNKDMYVVFVDLGKAFDRCFPFHNSNTNTPLHAIVIQMRKEAEIKPERIERLLFSERIERLLFSLNQTTETSENRNCQSSENRRFIMMTPQLFINYKLKSVAHLPWRMMSYKFLNTFIDDIFAFVIKMPTLYRLGCFRDDIVFFIFLYQRWIYKTDPTRVNEFGFSGEMEQEAAAARSGQQANGTAPAIAAAPPKDPTDKKED